MRRRFGDFVLSSRLLVVFHRRIPRRQECRPNDRRQQHHIELMPHRHESKVEQLDGNPKDPLSLLRFPNDIGNTIVYLSQRHALHGTHGTVVHAIANPTPIDKLFQNSLEDGNAQSSGARALCQILQKVEMQVRGGGVNEEPKDGGSSGADKIIVLFWNLASPLRNELCHNVSNTPQTHARAHFGQHWTFVQVSFVPLQERSRGSVGAVALWC